MPKTSTLIIVLLLIIIAFMGFVLVANKAEAPSVGGETSGQTPDTTGTTTTPPAPQALHDKIVITYPKSGATVPKKFTLTGKAPGNWFFEASAPVMVRTPEGDKVAQGVAQTIGDWMTTELVEFKAEVSVNPAYSGPATLVFLKDNPSGLPENDDSLEIPIIIE